MTGTETTEKPSVTAVTTKSQPVAAPRPDETMAKLEKAMAEHGITGAVTPQEGGASWLDDKSVEKPDEDLEAFLKTKTKGTA